MGKIKYLCVEPQAGDLLMSACHVLVAPEYDVRVLTVDNAPKPLAEQQRLYDFLGIEMDRLDLELEDVRCGDFKAHSADCNYEGVYMYLRAKYGNDGLNFAEQTLRDHLCKFMRRNPGYVMLAPLGVGHPFNQFVHDVVFDTASAAEYYRDFPYSYVPRGREQMTVKCYSAETLLMKRRVPCDDMFDVKWELAMRFYPSLSTTIRKYQRFIEQNPPEEIWYEGDLPF
jgi:hypothetical protein